MDKIHLDPKTQKEYMGNSMSSGGGKRCMARRLSMDDPSQKQTERCHPIENTPSYDTRIRPLTIREYAIIQTFPDEYRFCGGIHSQYRQIVSPIISVVHS
jgi:DNA (cytosine-5)-methyltransferase 1